MNRKFNTKKFIKDVLNDRYAHLKTAIQSVAKVSFCPSFGAPFMLLWPPYGDSEMARNGFEDGSKVMRRNMQLTDMCSSTYKTVFDALHIDESKEMNIGSSMKSILHSKCNF